jgi:hypothetical protein
LRSFVETLSPHELVDICGTIQNSFDVRSNRFVIVETIVESLRLFVEVFDESVDVVFTIGSIETTAIKRRVQTVTEVIRLIFDSMENSFDFLIAQSIGLPDHLRLRAHRCR